MRCSTQRLRVLCIFYTYLIITPLSQQNVNVKLQTGKCRLCNNSFDNVHKNLIVLLDPTFLVQCTLIMLLAQQYANIKQLKSIAKLSQFVLLPIQCVQNEPLMRFLDTACVAERQLTGFWNRANISHGLQVLPYI